MKLSLVMTYWDGGFRRPLLEKSWATIARQWQDDYELIMVDDGPEPAIKDMAEEHGWRYYHLQRDGYNNPARAMNVGIRKARGDVILLQSPEVYHLASTIKLLLSAVDEHVAVFPTCWSLDENGEVEGEYVGPRNRRPFFFCGAILRKHLLAVKGIDEDYTMPGWDDDDLSKRLFVGLGLRPVFRPDIHVYHQWHPRPDNIDDMQGEMAKLFHRKHGPDSGSLDIVCNQNRDWGSLETRQPATAISK